jgi:hypothetical protein
MVVGFSTLRDLEPTGPPDRTYKVLLKKAYIIWVQTIAISKTSFILKYTLFILTYPFKMRVHANVNRNYVTSGL